MTTGNFSEEHHGMQIITRQKDLTTLDIFRLPEQPTVPQRFAVARAISQYIGPSTPCDTMMDKVVSVIGVVSHPAQLVDTNTGELRDCMRTVFLLEDGSRLSGTSAALHRFAEQTLLPVLTESGQWGPLVAPVPVRLSRQRTSKGFNTYAPEVVE